MIRDRLIIATYAAFCVAVLAWFWKAADDGYSAFSNGGHGAYIRPVAGQHHK